MGQGTEMECSRFLRVKGHVVTPCGAEGKAKGRFRGGGRDAKAMWIIHPRTPRAPVLAPRHFSGGGVPSGDPVDALVIMKALAA